MPKQIHKSLFSLLLLFVYGCSTQAAIPSTSQSPTPTFTVTPEPVQAPSETPDDSKPCLRGSYVADVTIPDGQVMLPGETFTKTWRIINTGTCSWSTDFEVIFASGDQMEGADSGKLPHSVGPGETVDISMDMTAPQDFGDYQGHWQLRSAEGKTFGIGQLADVTFYVIIAVKDDTPVPTPDPSLPTVIWDTSHDPAGETDGKYSPEELYSDLAAVLANSGITLISSTDSLEEMDLSQFDGLVISATSISTGVYTETEIQAIDDYVEQGGGLLLIGERPEYPNFIRGLAQNFGVELMQEPEIRVLSDFKEHPVTHGLSQIDCYKAGTIQIYDQKVQVVASYGPVAGIAVIDQGAGRVVIVGDANMFDNRWIPNADNKQLAVNIIQWITRISDTENKEDYSGSSQ
jgi:hypothetical protein